MGAAKKIIKDNTPSDEGKAMDAAFKKATRRALAEAFKVRKAVMLERDGWLVMVDKEGRVRRRVKQLPKLTIPAA